jgi:hypothetical protein
VSKLVAQEIQQIAMVGENVCLSLRRPGPRWNRGARIEREETLRGRTGKVVQFIRAIVRAIGGLAVHARDEPAFSTPRMRRHHFGGFDFHAMYRTFGLRLFLGSGLPRVVARGSILLRFLVEFEQRGFGFARGFERLAQHWIHVVTPANKRHVASSEMREIQIA